MMEFLRNCFPKKITKDQSKDTGMAMVLLALLLGFLTDAPGFFPVAAILLVVTMAVPAVYRPIAFVWLGLSHFLGTIVSRILLTAVFFVIVLPVGLLRRVMGKDSLQLKKFGRGEESVMRVRDHVYAPSDIDKPY
jgi:hypothetical protein